MGRKKIHRCKGMEVQETLGWTNDSTNYFEIKGNELWAGTEYGLVIKYCPMCSKFLQGIEKK